MAIEPIKENDTDALDKMNRVIAEANKVGGKAEQSSLAAEVLARGHAITAEAETRAQALSAEAQAREAADAALTTQGELLAEPGRLGEAVRTATATLDGPPEATSPWEGEPVASSSCGAVLVLGSGHLAPRRITRIEPGRRYRLRVVMQRQADPSDPAGDAIRIGVRWLGPNKSGLSNTILADLTDVSVAAGRLEYSFRIATIDDDVDAVAPAGAVYVRPFIRAYGDGLLHVEVVTIDDVTTAEDWSPDVSQYRREVAGLVQRQGASEDRIKTLADALEIERQAAARAALAVVATDMDFAISAVADARVIRHVGALTQVRQAALILPGAETGATVRLVRSGPGAFALNVGPGLKAMATGSWADFTFDGTAWFVAAAGTL